MKSLLDTNAYTALFRGQENTFNTVMNASEVYLSTIVIGELRAGFKGGKRTKQNEEALVQFLQTPHIKVVSVSDYTADIYADIKHKLRRKGKLIPVNDVWIVAHTLEVGATLVTADKHFQYVSGLRLQKP